MFGHENVSETDERDVFRNLDALLQQRLGATDGDEIVRGLDGGGIALFIGELERGLRAVLNGAARVEDQLVVHIEARLAVRAAKSFVAFLRPDRGQRPGEVGDAFVSEFEQVTRGGVAGVDFFRLHAGELTAKRGGRAEQHDGCFA